MQSRTYAEAIMAVKLLANERRDALVAELLIADPNRTNQSILNRVPGTSNKEVRAARDRLGLPGAILGRPTRDRLYREQHRLHAGWRTRIRPVSHAAD
jgi:hypothetical protein